MSGTRVAVDDEVIAALLIGFVLAFFGSIPIAGPIAVAVLSMGLEHRSRSALSIAAGAAFAEAIYAFFAFWGLSTVLARFPILLPATHLLGCGLLIAFGVYLAVKKPKSKEAAQKHERSKALGVRNVLLGFTMTIVNPTLIVTWTVAVSAAHSSGLLRVNPRDAIPFSLGVGIGVISWFSAMIFGLAKFRSRVKEKKVNQFVRVMGFGLATIGACFAIRVLVQWK